MLKTFTITLTFLLLISSLAPAITLPDNGIAIPNLETNQNYNPTKQTTEEIIIIPDSDPFFGIISASLACWYDTNGTDVLKPLLVQSNKELTEQQNNFIDN